MINSVKFTESFSDSFNLLVQVTKDVNFGENHSNNFSEMCYYSISVKYMKFILKVKFE